MLSEKEQEIKESVITALGDHIVMELKNTSFLESGSVLVELIKTFSLLVNE